LEAEIGALEAKNKQEELMEKIAMMKTQVGIQIQAATKECDANPNPSPNPNPVPGGHQRG